MSDKYISKEIKYIGVDDKELELFENQYALTNGISYNSYLIKDEKTVIMDTVDKRKTDEWINNLQTALEGKNPDYLVISHLEPDHSGSIDKILEKYPNMKIISNEKVFNMFPQFMDSNIENKKVIVKEGDIINIGKHILQFIMAPMVHWPEVMLTYEQTEKILFSADAFGKFGTIETNDSWINEARRYYFNIVGKYGMQVQSLLRKASNLEIKTICPLHGSILKDNLNYYINLYDKWSKYEPEEKGILILCGSLHGNTYKAAKEFEENLKQKGINTKLIDVAKIPTSDIVPEAFKYSKLCIACVTYNMNIFPAMYSFLHLLKEKNYQNRKVGIIENGSWAPNAGKIIKEEFDTMKNVEILEPIVTIKTRLNEESRQSLRKLEEIILNNKI